MQKRRENQNNRLASNLIQNKRALLGFLFTTYLFGYIFFPCPKDGKKPINTTQTDAPFAEPPCKIKNPSYPKSFIEKLSEKEILKNAKDLISSNTKPKLDSSILINYLLKKAAEKNLPDAAYHLGLIYENGYDTPKDNKLALKWFEKAAGQDYLKAQFRLGEKFECGWRRFQRQGQSHLLVPQSSRTRRWKRQKENKQTA